MTCDESPRWRWLIVVGAVVTLTAACTATDSADDLRPSPGSDPTVTSASETTPPTSTAQLEINPDEATDLLFDALGDKDVELAEEAIGAGADLAATFLGDPPLLVAASNDFVPGLEALLEAGVDINTTNASGVTATMRAAGANRPDALRFLLANGADLTARQVAAPRYDAFLMAVAGGRGLESIMVLLDAGVDIGTLDSLGDPALTIAAWRGDAATTTYLLENGARFDIIGSQGRTALGWAEANNQVETAELLRSAGATG